MIRTLTLLFALAATAMALAQSPAPVSPPPAASTPQAQPAAAVPVVMYATAWCPYCAKARAYFKRTNTAYVEHDIEKSADAHAEFKRLGGRGVPLILVGSERLRGFNELAFESAYARAERAR
ncbi:MAG TPA: glutaredoxin domain-containing protein [Burkholderiales bacterium]|jgi:glutaredoxin|nr:glutaredoxin domain-containing protein [Burkholderiales bacterium]